MPRDQVANLAATDCQAAAFLRFARAPWVATRNGTRVIGDLRYDREAEAGFAEIELDLRVTQCPSHIPPWLPPRQDLIQADSFVRR
jgi:hypothetical protein